MSHKLKPHWFPWGPLFVRYVRQVDKSVTDSWTRLFGEGWTAVDVGGWWGKQASVV